MVQSVLGSLTLGYRPLWSRARRLMGVQLFVHARDEAVALNLPHLLRTLREIWSENSPPVLLSPQQPSLLQEFLRHPNPGAPLIEVQGRWLLNPDILEQVRAAHARGQRLVWRGDLSLLPRPKSHATLPAACSV